MSEHEAPRLIEGGLAVDDRGTLRFVNDFRFDGVKRFYLVENHQAGFVRAWHAHRREAKFVLVPRGAAIVAAVPIDNWEAPDKGAEVKRYVLSDQKPAVLRIPAAYANGFKTLTSDTLLMFFSTATVEESRGDDVRYDAYYWNPWQTVER